MVMVCMYIRPVTLESRKPPLSHTHAQRLAGHLPASKSPQSSEKPAVGKGIGVDFPEKAVIRQDTAAGCDAECVLSAALDVDKPVSVSVKEPATESESHAAGWMQDSVLDMQQEKEEENDALRLVVFYLLCPTLIGEFFSAVC